VPRDAERRRSGEQVEGDGGCGRQRRPQQHDQEQESETHDDAHHQREMRDERLLATEIVGIPVRSPSAGAARSTRTRTAAAP
jgi:hypothetical protein